jgi:nucleotide-binding universal stress UspA family protein
MSEPLIVVPLDGSELSEAALPYARLLAKGGGERLLLVTVWEGSEPALLASLPAVVKDITEGAERHYGEYLAGLTKQLEAEGVMAGAEVIVGNPVDEVLGLVKQRQPRLLVLATHGRSGLSRWWYGSVASKLIRHAPVPTLVVGPKVLVRTAAPERIGRILVPLDGSELSEVALQPALEIAGAFDASVVLTQVLGWAAQAYMYGVPNVDVAQIEGQLREASDDYLARVRDRLTSAKPIETKVLRGLPADCLTDLVRNDGIDLVVMASHGRGGIARAALGSIADRMLQAEAPVLLVRPGSS